MDDLIFLGTADQNGHWINPENYADLVATINGTGNTLPPGNHLHISEALDMDTLRLHLKNGDVTRLYSRDLLIKCKFPSYLKMHRAKYALTNKEIWRNIQTNAAWEAFFPLLPDEFQESVAQKAAQLRAQFHGIKSTVVDIAESIPAELDNRKDRAMWIKSNVDKEYCAMVMRYAIAGYSVDELIWKKIEPRGNALVAEYPF